MLNPLLSRLREAGVCDDTIGLPDSYSISDAAALIAEHETYGDDQLGRLILQSLRDKERIVRGPDDENPLRVIGRWASSRVTPPPGVDATEDFVQEHANTIAVYLQLLRCVRLDWHVPLNLDDSNLLIITAYTDSSDPWTLEQARSDAMDILAIQLGPEQNKVADFMLSVVLEGFLMSIFASSAPRYITSSGRRAHYDEPHKAPISVTDSREQAWKKEHIYAATILSWAIERGESSFVRHHWSLFIPPLLAVIEDSDTHIRAKGLIMVAPLMDKCGGKILRGTGLARIFEMALFPSLNYLPSLTPEHDSVRILRPAYSALLLLAQLLETHDGSLSAKILDRTIREGILSGYHHASEYPLVCELLMGYCAHLCQSTGIRTIRHLKDLLPMYSATLTNPFAIHHHGSLKAAISALHATVIVAWPRLWDGQHVPGIVEMLVTCWLNVQEMGDDKELDESAHALQDQLRQVWKIIVAIKPPSKDNDGDLCRYAALMEAKEPKLGKLFCSEV